MIRIPELDGLRGIAILLVIGCHYELLAARLWTLPRYGWVGVDIFFVLSGFLITSVLLKAKGREGAFRNFYTRRALRILPPYFMFLTLLQSTCVLFGDRTLLNLRTILGELFFLQAFSSLPQTISHLFHGFTQQFVLSPIDGGISGTTGDVSHSAGVLWSLSIEEYFYLLWAPAVLWLSKKRLVVLAIGICVFGIFIRWFAFIGLRTYSSGCYRADALIYGALVSLAITSQVPKLRARATAVLLLAGIALCATLLSLGPFVGLEIRESRVFEAFGLPAISLTIAATLALIIPSSGRLWLAPLRLGPLRFIGQISYMLYLMHAFVYLVILHFFSLNWAVTITAFGVSIVLCWLSWKYIEYPLLNCAPSAQKQSLVSHDAAAAVSAE